MKGEFYEGAGGSEKTIKRFEEECKQYQDRYFECADVKRYPEFYLTVEDDLSKLERCIENCLKEDIERSLQVIFRGYDVQYHLGFYDETFKHSSSNKTLLVIDSSSKLILSDQCHGYCHR